MLNESMRNSSALTFHFRLVLRHNHFQNRCVGKKINFSTETVRKSTQAHTGLYIYIHANAHTQASFHIYLFYICRMYYMYVYLFCVKTFKKHASRTNSVMCDNCYVCALLVILLRFHLLKGEKLIKLVSHKNKLSLCVFLAAEIYKIKEVI